MRNTMLRRWLTGSAIACAGLAALTGCGGDDPSPANEGGARNEQGAVPDGDNQGATAEQIAAWNTEHDQVVVKIDGSVELSGVMKFHAADGSVGTDRDGYVCCAEKSVELFAKENPDSKTAHSAQFQLNVESDGIWFPWVLVYWPDDCGNSLKVGIKDADGEWVQKPYMVSDGTTKKWHWLRAGPRMVKLSKGIYTVVVQNHEDGARLSRLLLDTRGTYTPANPES